MNSQPSLIPGGSGSPLPGPQFESRPGWGGQLSSWFSENAYVVVFRLLVLAALILIIASIIKNNPERTADITPTPTALPQATTVLTVRAEPGDGLTHVAARILDVYLAQQIPPLTLTAAQHLFAVDSLARAAGWGRLERDQEVVFAREMLDVIAIKAQTLTKAQEASWARLLRR